MKEIKILKRILICGLFVLTFSAKAQEVITFGTYYPSPRGLYADLRAKRVAIGPNYSDPTQYCWGTTCTNSISDDTVLIVEGDVGIGTHAPDGRLEVDYNGSSTGTTLVLDDSTDPSADPWENVISFRKQGTEYTKIGIDGTVDSGDPSLESFFIDITTNATTSGEPEFTINPQGNVAIDGINTDRVPPNGQTDSNLEVNDIYVRAIDSWLSEVTGGGGVYFINSSGNAAELSNPAFVVGKARFDQLMVDNTIAWQPEGYFSSLTAAFVSNTHYSDVSCWEDFDPQGNITMEDWPTPNCTKIEPDTVQHDHVSCRSRHGTNIAYKINSGRISYKNHPANYYDNKFLNRCSRDPSELDYGSYSFFFGVGSH